MVTVESCRLSTKSYGSTYKDAFLQSDVNHVDGTGGTGKLDKSIVRQWMGQIG